MRDNLIKACVFDAYGTLFDVHSAVAEYAEIIGPHAAQVSNLWRQKQLEYTWVRSLMGRHADFWTVTGESLDHALAAHGIDDVELRANLMAAYLRLAPYPEVAETLAGLREQGLTLAILSNGSPSMLEAAVQSAGLGPYLDMVLSVEEAGIFKPAAKVYDLAVDRLGLSAESIYFASANPWDGAAAANYGFHALWVNRAGATREYAWAGEIVEVLDLKALSSIIAPLVKE
ncbi:MAG: haloacid dehalogenase type II [Alphaproteobacteria bacterium]|nr:haloacid dehalogenase type II [Alphaproteobacteria bacterium]